MPRVQRQVQNRVGAARRADAQITRKGRATRDRIVSAAASLMHQHGVADTGMPAIRDAAGVSSSQIYHYFANKDALTAAVIAFRTDLILSGQSSSLARLDNLDALRAWRDFVVDAARTSRGRGGCPLGSLAGELSDDHPWARTALEASFRGWCDAIRDGLQVMVDSGRLRPDADTHRLALALLTALQGGLLLAQTYRDVEPLAVGLDAVIAHVESYAAPGVGDSATSRTTVAVGSRARRRGSRT